MLNTFKHSHLCYLGLRSGFILSLMIIKESPWKFFFFNTLVFFFFATYAALVWDLCCAFKFKYVNNVALIG